MASVSVAQVSKRFGAVLALAGVSLSIEDGEFLTVLGPSGSGKSTLLRIIAGLDLPETGTITIGGRMVCGDSWVPPQERGVGMVFQSYALWPHMTAYENVAFPLEMAGLSRAEIRTQVCAALRSVELAGFEAKRPDQMSGGEQQRVALARALVGRPSLLLMDECLSNLDARLREKMAVELRQIQTTLGITTIYVTHDQHEALALSDRIAVLHRGRLQQIGPPHELYRRPCTSMVAAALGPINMIPAQEAARVGLDLPAIHAPAILGVRPEDVVLFEHNGAGGRSQKPTAPGRVSKCTFMGDHYECWIDIGGYTIHARIRLGSGSMKRIPKRSEEVCLGVDPEDWIVMEDGSR